MYFWEIIYFIARFPDFSGYLSVVGAYVFFNHTGKYKIIIIIILLNK